MPAADPPNRPTLGVIFLLVKTVLFHFCYNSLMKTTRANNFSYKNPIVIIFTIFIVLIIAGLAYLFISVLNHPLTEDGLYQNWFLKSLYLVAIGIFIILCTIWPISLIMSALSAHRQIAYLETTNEKFNPYQYYKELPNNYGIGVASLLANSTIENEKDIIAAILDLCAQGYLHLSKHSDHYVIYLQPVSDKAPLKNEAYLLALIGEGKINKIDYRQWYNLCVEDGINLGVYQKVDTSKLTKLSSPNLQKYNRKRFQLLIAFLICLFVMTIGFMLPHDFANIITGAGFIGLIIVVTLAIANYVKNVFIGFKHATENIAQTNYKNILENYLVKTKHGLEELQKLEGFKNFLAQFNIFVDKDPEAVILWDRYLSYAQVFGLADELMRSGYHELIDNVAFEIDDINHITLSNLEMVSKASS